MSTARFHCIPDELKRLAQFVVWRYEWRAGNKKPTKMPYSARTLRLASVTDSSTWATFEETVAAFALKADGAASGFDGIGFVFTEGDPFAGIDLDETEAPSILDRQRTIFASFNSYSGNPPVLSGAHS